MLVANWLVPLPHTHSKFYNFGFLVGVDVFGVVTEGCGSLANPIPLSLLCLKLLTFECNGKGEDPGNVVEAVKTRVVANTFNNIVGQCDKLATSLGGHVNSKLQSFKPFGDGGSPNKVIGTFKGSQIFKAWHYVQVFHSFPLSSSGIPSLSSSLLQNSRVRVSLCRNPSLGGS
jgi:hypothetical protein